MPNLTPEGKDAKKTKFKEKVNQYFRSYTNIVVFLVLIIFILVQFMAYREALYFNIIHDADNHARILANSLSGINKGDNLTIEVERIIKDNIKMFNEEHSNLVKLKVFRFVTQTNSWEEIYSVDRAFNNDLSGIERRIAYLGSRFFKKNNQLWFNGEGFVSRETVDINAGSTTKLSLVLDLDANEFIQKDIRNAVILSLLLAGIVISLILQYRLLFLRLYKPLANLIDGMKIISQGNMDYKIPVEQRDELGRFIESFNCMVAELKKSREGMEQELSVTKQQREAIFKVYKDVIYAVTQGKFLLVNIQEIHRFIDDGVKLAKVDISKSKDVGLVRQVSKQVVNELFPQYDKTHKILLCISEAATNILKHAGTGTLTIKKMDNYSIRFIFKDQGPGMNFNHLPSMLFYKGFSTKISLGYGFNLIYSIVDKMILSTSKNGTTVAFDIIFSND